jgi:hypothetical protein
MSAQSAGASDLNADRLGEQPSGMESTSGRPRPLNPATALCLIVLAVASLGTAWGWAVMQLVELLIRPELNTLHEQIAGIGWL